MGPLRGLILIVFGLLALYRGWTMGTSRHAWLAYVLGIVALALGAWHIVREAGRQVR